MEAYIREPNPSAKAMPMFGMGTLLSVSMTVPTDAQDSGDVIADTQIVSANAFLEPNGSALLHYIAVYDTDDQKIAMDVVFMSSSASLGTEDSAPNISDANALLAKPKRVAIVASDYKDYGGVSVAEINQVGKLLKAPSDSTSLWLALMTGGTPTYASGIITVEIGLVY